MHAALLVRTKGTWGERDSILSSPLEDRYMTSHPHDESRVTAAMPLSSHTHLQVPSLHLWAPNTYRTEILLQVNKFTRTASSHKPRLSPRILGTNSKHCWGLIRPTTTLTVKRDDRRDFNLARKRVYRPIFIYFPDILHGSRKHCWKTNSKCVSRWSFLRPFFLKKHSEH